MDRIETSDIRFDLDRMVRKAEPVEIQAGMGNGPGFPARRFRDLGFSDPARNGSGLTRRFLTRDPEILENVTRTRPSPEIFLKYNPDPAGMGQAGQKLGVNHWKLHIKDHPKIAQNLKRRHQHL